ncbi:MAG: cytochrome c [Actinomycetota bacterium]|nr:cytochrome c [Actinomycetota bacterium]
MDELQVGRARRPFAIARAVPLALALVLAACGTPESPAVPGEEDGSADPELVAGREVYEEQCARCHGASGGGGSGPGLGDGAVVDNFPDAAGQRAVIVEGVGGMPSFGDRLSDDEIDAVVRYTREVL